jgi:hypothetical protein
LKPGKVHGRVDHGLDVAVVVNNRMTEINGRDSGDAPDLIVAHAEIAGFGGATEIAPIGDVYVPAQGYGTAPDVPIRIGDAQVRVVGIELDVLSECCRTRLSFPAQHSRKVRYAGQQTAGVLDQLAVFLRRKADQGEGLASRLISGLRAVSGGHIRDGAKCRNDGSEYQKQNASAEAHYNASEAHSTFVNRRRRTAGQPLRASDTCRTASTIRSAS